jgi:hypothetical protein
MCHLSQPRCACHDNNYAFGLEVPRLPTNVPVEDLDLAGIASPMLSPSPGPLDFDFPYKPLAALPEYNEANVGIGGTPLFPEARDWVMDYFEGTSATYGAGETFLSQFDKDQYLKQRRSNPYYPFTSSKDWMEAKFLLKSRLSMALIDEYLSMDVVHGLGI